MRVCLVAEELSSVGRSGGIGAAFEELACLLARNGAEVDVLYCGPVPEGDAKKQAEDRLQRLGVHLDFLNTQTYAWARDAQEAKSYAVCRHLMAVEQPYDVIHFHEYHGLGFFPVRAKRQGLAFRGTQLVVQLHGASEWTIEANSELPTHGDVLKNFHLERGSIAGADHLVCPSAYLVDWMRGKGFDMPPAERVHVIRNVCTNIVREIAALGLSRGEEGTTVAVDEIVMFGRHETRKGFTQFIDGVDQAKDLLAERGVKVTFLGRFGKVNGRHSGAHLSSLAQKWEFPLEIIPDANRSAALDYLAAHPNSAVFVPSPYENSPYTVLELLAAGKPLICSDQGGGKELIDEKFHDEVLMPISAQGIADAIERVLDKGLVVPGVAEKLEDTEATWIDFHNLCDVENAAAAVDDAPAPAQPKVVVGITHHERPRKLLDALMSIARQTYSNMEIVILDDGSTSEQTLADLKRMQPVFDRCGARLIMAENGYLGAARNRIAQATESDYLCFLDDDDIAHPELVETLVKAAESTGADLMNCLNVFMPEVNRAEMLGDPAAYDRPVSYVPMGGPLALAPTANVFGAATALIRRSAFDQIGGYTELRGVGHEDYELFVRMSQVGLKLDVAPVPLYLYEVDRPSMISRTSVTANFRRVIEAIKPELAPEAWLQFMAVESGRAAAENTINRRVFESQRDGLWGIEQPLFDGFANLDDELEALVRFAGGVDAQVCEEAFRRALARRRGGDQGRPVVRPRHQSVAMKVAPEVSDVADDLGVRLAVAMGDVPAATQGILDLLGARWGLTQEDLAALGAYREMEGLDQASVRKVEAQLRQFDATGTPMQRPLGVLQFGFAVDAGETERAAAMLEQVAEAEEEAYLARHRDVAKAVEDGRMMRALQHYCGSGRKENRRGFDGLRALVSGTDVEVLRKVVPASITSVVPAFAEVFGLPAAEGAATK